MITSQELSEKAPLIHEGMEFQVLNHAKTMPLTIRDTSVATIKKSSCWGDYQKTVVWFDTICQALKQVVVTKHRDDGTSYSRLEDVPNPGVFYTDSSHMSMAGFIEYKYNKMIKEIA